jgi:RHS repeat-associated protein
VIQEPTWTRANGSTPTWTSTGVRTYVLGPLPDERLIYRAADGQVYYPHTDRRGSTVALSRAGRAVETYAYDEFGRSGATGPSGYPWRYTGQRLDPWTGTYHYKAREYSPQLGRFLQADPARFVDGPNIYAYVGNNPWNATDPTGMWQPPVARPPARPRGRGPGAGRRPQTEPASPRPLRPNGVPFEPASRSEILTALQPNRRGDVPRTYVYADPTGRGPLVRGEGRGMDLIPPEGYIRVELIGTPQRTVSGGRDTNHASRSLEVGLQMAQSGRFGQIYFNRSLATCSGGSCASPYRPDVVGVYRTGGFQAYEQLSPGQRGESLYQRLSPWIPPTEYFSGD